MPKAQRKTHYTHEEALALVLDSSEEDSEFDSDDENMIEAGLDPLLDWDCATGDCDVDWEPPVKKSLSAASVTPPLVPQKGRGGLHLPPLRFLLLPPLCLPLLLPVHLVLHPPLQLLPHPPRLPEVLHLSEEEGEEAEAEGDQEKGQL
ncbi:hypothetical protein WMY93_015125 [Mugilogobius chulae]|uniref:Uncharacterized protein n=1 Tax=Mugilogobius chulae TaxID=88201 RepID=A0AAW0NWK6_9GOBI